MYFFMPSSLIDDDNYSFRPIALFMSIVIIRTGIRRLPKRMQYKYSVALLDKVPPDGVGKSDVNVSTPNRLTLIRTRILVKIHRLIDKWVYLSIIIGSP
jgi:hypothetical protein